MALEAGASSDLQVAQELQRLQQTSYLLRPRLPIKPLVNCHLANQTITVTIPPIQTVDLLAQWPFLEFTVWPPEQRLLMRVKAVKRLQINYALRKMSMEKDYQD